MSPLRVVLREKPGQRAEDVPAAPAREYYLHANRVFEFLNVKEDVSKYDLEVYTKSSRWAFLTAETRSTRKRS